MVVKSATVARLEKWAALIPALLALWGVVGWGLRADAQLRTLDEHDHQYQRDSIQGTDRLARLEEAQKDASNRLDRMDNKLDVILRQTR